MVNEGAPSFFKAYSGWRQGNPPIPSSFHHHHGVVKQNDKEGQGPKLVNGLKVGGRGEVTHLFFTNDKFYFVNQIIGLSATLNVCYQVS